MNYVRVPTQIELGDVESHNCSWSAGMYRRIEIPTRKTKTVRDLLVSHTRGSDPGSIHYAARSTRYLIRTKALQPHSYLLYPKGSAVTPISPRVFQSMGLADGDILLSKDSNVGECAMVDGAGWENYMLSGGIVLLKPAINRHYLFAFLKHPLFKAELLSMVPRGATIAHANDLWLDCHIPFPSQPNAEAVIRYVASLTEAILDKQRDIKKKNDAIFSEIDTELSTGRCGIEFRYEYPTLGDIRESLRFDTGLYCRGFRAFQHRINNYSHGSTTLSAMGVVSRRGPNLAVTVIGKSLYSETHKVGWYELIRPVNISEYGTLTSREWLGSPKELSIVRHGDLILGCEGFSKGRSIVLIDAPERCTTNFHGTVLSWPGSDVWQVVFVRCFLAFLREQGVIDWVGVGGSGGHMSPEYFDQLPFPCFPEPVQKRIARLYHNPSNQPQRQITSSNFVEWHREWNSKLGIWELNREMQVLQARLAEVQSQIIDGRVVTVLI
jgi:hypothetical protein